ncbi:MAG: transcriptional regulator [Azonexus sp.]|jgi:HTH-type transcriptional regulator/antitoxin HigA|nr:transcriptional regulator [Azonexus sp.]
MEAVIPDLAQVARSYGEFRAVAGVGAIRTEADYERALELIAAILAQTRDTPAREDAAHPLADLLDLLTAAAHEYEADHHAIPAVSPREALRFLMEQHGLKQSDLPEVGSQSVISEILAGRRLLNTRQIAALVERFRVSADAFIGGPPSAVPN